MITISRIKLTPVLSLVSLLGCLVLSAPSLGARQTADDEDLFAKPIPAFMALPVLELYKVDDPPEPVVALPVGELEEPEPRILISLADQQMWVFEGDEILQRFPVSTGVPGHRTPTGRYSVRSRAPRAYSNRYECWMTNWMAITADGLYGMHGLQGTSYLRRLGSVASHGCIRLAREDAQWLYEWVETGTPVEIVADWDEPEEETDEGVGVDVKEIVQEFVYW